MAVSLVLRTAPFPTPLIDAAAYERDRRAAKYPPAVADGKLDAEAATIDYQAWCAIAEWLERGSCRLINGWGGTADAPDTLISWQLLEDCAAKAVAQLDAKLAREAGNADVAAVTALGRRRDDVFIIHDLMVKARQSADRTAEAVRLVRAELAEERQGKAAAA